MPLAAARTLPELAGSSAVTLRVPMRASRFQGAPRRIQSRRRRPRLMCWPRASVRVTMVAPLLDSSPHLEPAAAAGGGQRQHRGRLERGRGHGGGEGDHRARPRAVHLRAHDGRGPVKGLAPSGSRQHPDREPDQRQDGEDRHRPAAVEQQVVEGARTPRRLALGLGVKVAEALLELLDVDVAVEPQELGVATEKAAAVEAVGEQVEALILERLEEPRPDQRRLDDVIELETLASARLP